MTRKFGLAACAAAGLALLLLPLLPAPLLLLLLLLLPSAFLLLAVDMAVLSLGAAAPASECMHWVSGTRFSGNDGVRLTAWTEQLLYMCCCCTAAAIRDTLIVDACTAATIKPCWFQSIDFEFVQRYAAPRCPCCESHFSRCAPHAPQSAANRRTKATA
jgi:hypothetical protein